MEVKASVSSNLRWDVHLEFNDTGLKTNRFLQACPNKKILLPDGYKTATLQFFKRFQEIGISSCQILYKHKSNFWFQWKLNNSEIYWRVTYAQVSKSTWMLGCFKKKIRKQKRKPRYTFICRNIFCWTHEKMVILRINKWL